MIVKLITEADNLGPICAQMQPGNWAADNEMTSYSPSALKSFLADGANILLLAYDDERIVGAALAYEMPHPEDKKYLYLHELDTHPDYRRQGVGKLLMQELIAVGRSRGLSEMWLEVDNDNLGAQKLYDSFDPSAVDKTITYSYKL